MRAYVQKWGNSLAVRIPKSFAEECALTESSPVDLTLEDGRLVIARAGPRGFTLDALLAGVSSENLHGEAETGPAVGNEAW